MARLTETDKAALRELSEKGWIQSEEERSPVFVEATPQENQRYCRWVTELSKLLPTEKPVRFIGSDWRL
jgi:hypothetical protein